jgi:hypothetical protein
VKSGVLARHRVIIDRDGTPRIAAHIYDAGAWKLEDPYLARLLNDE